MSIMQPTLWLVVTSCLLVSACTERTVINEAPEGESTALVTPTEADDPALADPTTIANPTLASPTLASPTLASPTLANPAPTSPTVVPSVTVDQDVDVNVSVPQGTTTQNPATQAPVAPSTPITPLAPTTGTPTPVMVNGDVVNLPTTPITPVVVSPATPTTSDIPQATSPVIADPLLIDPLEPAPLVADPLIVDPLLADPLVEDPLVADPLIVDPLVADPLLEDPLAPAPLVADPLVVDPLVIDPLLADPLLEDPLVSDPTGLGTVTPATPTVPAIVETSAEAPAIIGTPGTTVNCQLMLPCQWISVDTQFVVTVTNADNIGEQSRLAIEYTIQTSHDSELTIASTVSAVDSTGDRYEAASLLLGDAIGAQTKGIVAGTDVLARIEFNKTSNAASVDWSIGLSDAGLVREPAFTNIPIGSVTDQHADCANTLPCAWITPAGDVTITLLSANGSGAINRLSTNFTVETTRNTGVVVDAGATAIGTDGMMFAGRTHAIGVETGSETIAATATPGVPVSGTVFFSRTQTMSPALQNLSLVVYEDRPVPRWNPSFLSVPVQ